MSSNAEERAAVFQSLARAIIDSTGAQLAQEHQSRRTLEQRMGEHVPVNLLGDDLEPSELSMIERLFQGENLKISPFEEAQLREKAFWRWVAFEGYGGKDPRLFPFHQQHFMLSTFYKTDWSLADFEQSRILELGCGPLGMIEYLKGQTKFAYDPLNAAYARLFSRCRGSDVQYMSDRDQLVDLTCEFDLVICHNVIDHTEDPAWWFDTLFSKLRSGGRFLFQVNLSEREYPQQEEHRKMHPSPFSEQQIHSWLTAKSDNYSFAHDPKPSADNEFYFLAWGTKTAEKTVQYVNAFSSL